MIERLKEFTARRLFWLKQTETAFEQLSGGSGVAEQIKEMASKTKENIGVVKSNIDKFKL